MSIPGAHRSFSRRGLLGLVVVLVTVGGHRRRRGPPTAGGQAPLPCDGDLYITTGSPDDMTLTRVDQATGALTPIGGRWPGGPHRWGTTPQDGFLYGMDRDAPHGIVRVSAGGDETGPSARPSARPHRGS